MSEQAEVTVANLLPAHRDRFLATLEAIEIASNQLTFAQTQLAALEAPVPESVRAASAAVARGGESLKMDLERIRDRVFDLGSVVYDVLAGPSAT